MDTQFIRCRNGHYYDARQYRQCPYCPSESTKKETEESQKEITSAYTQYRVNSQDEEAVTERLVSSFEEEGYCAGTEEQIRRMQAAEDTDVRMRKGRSSQDVTVRLSDAGSPGIEIDPVKVALSEPIPVQKPYPENKTVRTVGKWNGSESVLCPVGWLVCIDGPDIGKSFPLKEGRNSIGRSEQMDVVLKNDRAVSRQNHAWVEYQEERRCFFASAGEARKLVYVNDDLLLTQLEMGRNDVLVLGDSSLMLIPCCDERFSWKSIR